MKKKLILQKAGASVTNTIDEDIAELTRLMQFDESAQNIINQLQAIKDCSNVINLLALQGRLGSEDVLANRHLNEKLRQLESTGTFDGPCPNIVENGDIIPSTGEATIASVSVEPSSTYQPSRNIDSFNPPASMPGTQSTFYMPPIAEAFYLARGEPVPQNILNASGRVLNLRNRATGEQLINVNQYNLMVQAIVEYLRQESRLATLEQQFRADRYPTANEGHISGDQQEALLASIVIPGIEMYGSQVSAQIFLESIIGAHY